MSWPNADPGDTLARHLAAQGARPMTSGAMTSSRNPGLQHSPYLAQYMHPPPSRDGSRPGSRAGGRPARPPLQVRTRTRPFHATTHQRLSWSPTLSSLQGPPHKEATRLGWRCLLWWSFRRARGAASHQRVSPDACHERRRVSLSNFHTLSRPSPPSPVRASERLVVCVWTR